VVVLLCSLLRLIHWSKMPSLTRIDCTAQRLVASAGTLYCKVYAVDVDGKPTGDDIGTDSVNLDTIPVGDGNEVAVSFTFSGVTLVAGTEYAFVFEVVGDGGFGDAVSLYFHDLAGEGNNGTEYTIRDHDTGAWTVAAVGNISVDVYFSDVLTLDSTASNSWEQIMDFSPANDALAATNYTVPAPPYAGPTDIVTYKRIVAFGNNNMYYEDI